MAKKIRMINLKKRTIIISLIILIFLIFIIQILKKKDYEISYKIKDYEITEKFYLKDKYYSFTLTKDEEKYHFLQSNISPKSKKIIKDIKEFKTDHETCLIPENNDISFLPQCYNGEQISYHITSDEMKNLLNYQGKENTKEEKYHNLNIYNHLNKDIYIWNYRGFDRIKAKKSISIFNKDIYNPSLITQVNNLLWIPNYENDYYFKDVIIFNMNTEEQTKWQLSEPIYFDSDILGVYDNKIYLIDKHEKKEIELDILKKEMKVVNEKVYQNGWQTTTINKLLYQNNTFYGIYPKEYVIYDNYLYEENEGFRKKINKDPINLIAHKYKDSVYYFIKSKLYYYDEENGPTLLVENFEWNFNKDNIIFAIE